MFGFKNKMDSLHIIIVHLFENGDNTEQVLTCIISTTAT